MRYLVTLIILFVITPLQAITWSKVYGTIDEEVAHIIKQTPDSGYIVLGHSGYSKAWLIKLDYLGDSSWSKTYDSFEYPYLDFNIMDIEIDYDSGFIIALNYGEGTHYDLRILKTDPNGNIIWSNLYNIDYSSFDKPYDLDKTSDSCYIVVGNAMYGNSQTFIFKLTKNGDSLWFTKTGGEAYFTGVCENSEKGFIATIVCDPYYNRTVLEYDSFGNFISIVGYGDSYGQDIEMLNDSNYIVAAGSHLYKINENLDSLWSIEQGGIDVEPSDSGFVIVYQDNSDGYLQKYNADGDSLWSSSFGGSGDDALYSVSKTYDGGYICCGYTDSWGAGDYDFYIIKTDSLGNALGVEEELVEEELQHFLSFQNMGNKEISINFSILEDQHIELKLYDIMGRLISIPVSGYFTEGDHSVDLQLESEGLYLYRVGINSLSERGKFIVF